ncbi:hypothetical protein [Streptomyces sp.]|uniref:hypothetical protein n=1 Tax=Streptomyces sp. TaxID=1931 RepID=UPI002D793063|nr:hypothetical protein [Streptomyces sp.]HET6354639.1 hypothetical protein [Streptomyces sp.]
MTRAQAVIADAVAAVIAAQLQTALNEDQPRVTEAEAKAVAAAAIRALQRDGWHITAHPPR